MDSKKFTTRYSIRTILLYIPGRQKMVRIPNVAHPLNTQHTCYKKNCITACCARNQSGGVYKLAPQKLKGLNTWASSKTRQGHESFLRLRPPPARSSDPHLAAYHRSGECPRGTAPASYDAVNRQGPAHGAHQGLRGQWLPAGTRARSDTGPTSVRTELRTVRAATACQ